MFSLLLKLLRIGLGILVILTVLLVLSMVVATQFIDYRQQTEQLLTRHLQQPVTIDEAQLSWGETWQPELQLTELKISSAHTHLDIAKAQLQLDLLRSFRQLSPVLAKVQINGRDAMLELSSKDLMALNMGDLTQSGQAFSPRQYIETALAGLRPLQQLNFTFERLWLQTQTLPKQVLAEDVTIRLQAEDTHKTLNATMQLAPAFGDEFVLDARIAGNNADLQLNTELKLAAFTALPQGHARIELWSGWHNQALTDTRLQAQLDHDHKTLRLKAQRPQKTGDWQAQVYSGTNLLAEFAQLEDQRWQGEAHDLELAELSALWQIAQPANPWPRRLKPSGRIEQLQLDWQGDELALTADIADLSTQAWQQIPAIQGLQAQLDITGQQGSLKLSGEQLTVDWTVQRAPMRLQLQTDLAVQRNNEQWHISTQQADISNEDIKAELRGGIQFGAEGLAFEQLELAFDQVNVAHISTYLPVAIMNPKLVAWLDRALVAGTAGQGILILDGAAADFPFTENTGEFITQFRVADMQLDYFPGWEPIQNLSALVTFKQQGLIIEADGGSLGGAEIQQVQAHFDDLSKPLLVVESSLVGKTARMLEVLENSPLREKIWTRLSGLQVNGTNGLRLDLQIPIKGKNKAVTVAGAVEFAGGTVAIPEYHLQLEQVDGVLNFTNTEVSAKNLKLRFLGAPARLDIASQTEQLDFRLRGRFAPAAMLQTYHLDLAQQVKGSSDWDIVLHIPRAEKTRTHFQLSLNSNLQGTEITLPPPFNKTAGSSRALQLDLHQQQHLRLQLDIASGISAALMVQRAGQNWQVERGELRINSGTASLPEQARRILIARLPEYSLQLNGAGAGLTLFDHSEVVIKQLQLERWQLHDVRLQGQAMSDGFTVKLDGHGLAGRVFIPQQLSNAEPLSVQLDRLILHATQAVSSSRATASQPPPTHISIAQIKLDQHDFGRLELVLEPNSYGIALSKFELGNQQQRLSATGQWQRRGSRDWSQISAKFYSEALGHTLETLQIPIQLEGAKTALGIELNWRDTLTAPDLASLAGEVQVHIEQGQLTGIKPGFGRIVGLLNITSLARRLALDFSDLVATGLAFDQVDGTLRFDQGRIHTEDLLLQGPAVNIALQGWLNLPDQRLQQTITVVPQIASSLAVAGAVAGGPAVGAVVLLAGQVLKPELAEAIGRQYRISGTLAKPLIEQINAQPPDNSEAANDGMRK